MLPAGKSLRTLREKLGLTMRDVENSSARVADKYRNEEFSIPPSRLSDIETKGILPSIYRLYTLSVIYRRDLRELMSWYGVDLNNLASDLGLVSPPKSHVSDALAGLTSVQVPVRMDPGFHDVSHFAAWQFHPSGRIKKQSGGRFLAFGIRTSNLFRGNPRGAYLLLV